MKNDRLNQIHRYNIPELRQLIVDTILDVVRKDLCTGCGTCFSICMENAITIIKNNKNGQFEPIIDADRCINCGDCLRVCPGFVDWMSCSYSSGDVNRDGQVADICDYYHGRTEDEQLSEYMSRGGIVTSFLHFLIEEKIVDAVIISNISFNGEIRTEPMITSDCEEISRRSGSLYCPVPMNVVLKQIVKEDNQKRFAFVGLPCHMAGIKLYSDINRKINEKIIIKIGLFCVGTPSFIATRKLLKKYSISENELIDLRYRGLGNPGKMLIAVKNKKIIVNLYDYYNYDFYSRCLNRCLICNDNFCAFSDISVGDARNINTNNHGHNWIIIKSKDVDGIIHEMENRKIIKIQRVSGEQFINLYGYNNNNGYREKRIVSKLFLKELPLYGRSEQYKISLRKLLSAFFSRLDQNLSKKEFSNLLKISHEIQNIFQNGVVHDP